MRAPLSILTAIAGLLFFLAGMSLPWFALPTGFAPDGSLILRDAPATPWWKVACIIWLTLLALWWFRKRKSNPSRAYLTAGLAVLLPFLLWYPQAVIVHDETVSGDAAWMQQQFDNLTWLGGDVFRGHSERPVPDGFGVWAQDPPQRLAAFRPPMAGTFSLGIAQLPDLIWWFGYNPAFNQFVARGWILSVLGVMLALIGAFGWGQRGEESGRRRAQLRGTAKGLLASSTVVLILAMLPIILGGRALRQAREHTLAWQPQPALEALDLAEKRMPALRIDTGVILQRGSLQRQLGENEDPSSQLQEAWLLFEEGNPQRSAAIIDQLISQPEKLTASQRREAMRGLLRSAVNDLNSSRITEARRRFRILLEHEPTCLQGWFHYQLASLQAGDLEANRIAARRVEMLAATFHRKEKRGIIAASQGMLAQGELGAGNTEAAVAARQRAQGR